MIRQTGFLLALIMAAAWANALNGAFQFDDYNVIVDNPAVHGWPALQKDLLAGGIRPLLKLSYLLNWASGLGPTGFIAFNLAVHGINVLLVYRLGIRLLDGSTNGPEPVTPALLAAMVFALHPVQTEAVTYICGRSVSLMSVFYLGSILAYDHGRETRRAVLVYLVSPLLFVCAVAVKEVAVTLPAALALWEAGRRPVRSWRHIVRTQWVHWLTVAAMAGLFLTHRGYTHLLGHGFAQRSIAANLLAQVNGIAYLLSRLALIGDLNIDPDIALPQGWTPALAAQATGLALLGLAGLAGLVRCPLIGFGICWFWLHLAPTNSIVARLDIANERQLYLAGWGLYLVLTVPVCRLTGGQHRFRRIMVPTTAALAIVLAGWTAARNRDYHSETALWQATVAKSPFKARAHNNLGYALYLEGRHAEARAAFLQALRLDPADRLARANLRLVEDGPRR